MAMDSGKFGIPSALREISHRSSMVVCGVLVPVLHLIYVSCPATSTMKQQWRKAKEDQWKEVVSREEKKKKKRRKERAAS